MTSIEVWIEADEIDAGDAVALAARAEKFLANATEAMGYTVEDSGVVISGGIVDQ
jgi:hypothetical protein